MNSKGFTLVELMVSIIIVAILITLSAGAYSLYGRRARLASVENNLYDVYQISQLSFADGTEEVNLEILASSGFKLHDSVILDIENGTEEALYVEAWHVSYPNDVFILNALGEIKRR